ncbi:MAG: glycosyltransferase [Cyanobacteria bacterium P01_A01_bin.40]
MTKVAYLINQYPAVSHSFIRREIAALENLGIEIFRFSVRSLASELVDEADKQELKKTKFILDVGIAGLIFNLFWVALTRPIRFLTTFMLTLKVGWAKDKGLIVHFAYLAEACVLLRWVTAVKATHVHAHFAFNPSAVAMFCHSLGGPPYSFTIHGPESIDRAIILSLEEKVRRAKFVAAISSFARSQLFRWCDYENWSKIRIIRCGLDSQFLDSPPTQAPKNSRFVCVARLNEQKGHLVLLQAFKNLVEEGYNPKLVLVGDGVFRPQVEKLIQELELVDYIEITGWVTNEEVRQQILASQAMVLASFAEGLPVVIMEALALGRPVVSTYVAGIPELLEENTCGWLVPSGSVMGLTSAMRKVLQTPEDQLEQMSKIGFERVSKFHNAAIEAQKLADLFVRSSKENKSF